MAIQFDNTNTGVVTLRPGTASDAIILGGSGNAASSSSAVVGGGFNNTANGEAGFIGGGASNTAGGTNSAVVGGASNNAASGNTFIGGGSTNSANASTASVVGGSLNAASGINSTVLGGRRGTTRSITGSVAASASVIPIADLAGAQQTATLILGRETTNTTATVLTSNSSAAATTNQIILPNNSAYFFRGEVVAGVTGAGDTKGWTVEGVIKRGANAASTVLVGTPTVTSSYADAGASAWTITATADTTNGGLAITVTGQAATTIRWVAQIRTTEMTY